MRYYSPGIMCVTLLICAAPGVARADDPVAKLSAAEKKRLLALVKLGEEAYEAGRLEEARTSFDAALKIAPIGGVFYRIALCHERLDAPEQAVAAYRRYLELVPDATNRGRVEADIARLDGVVAQRKIARLAITTTPAGAEVAIEGGATLGVTPVEVDLPAGAHKITLSYTGHRPHAATVQLRAGETTRLDVALVARSVLTVTTRPAGASVREGGPDGALLGVTPLELEREPGPWLLHLSMSGHDAQLANGQLKEGESARIERLLMASAGSEGGWTQTVGYGALIAGGLGATASVVLWALAAGAHSDAEAAYNNPIERRNGTYENLKADAESLQTWALVSTISAGVLLGGGGALLLFAGPAQPADSARLGAPAAPPTVQVRWSF